MRDQPQESEWTLSCQRSGDVSRICAVTFSFFICVDVDAEFIRKSVLSNLLYAGGLVLMHETIEGLGNQFIEWKEAFGNKGLRVNFGKTKVTAHLGVTKDGLSESKLTIVSSAA